MYLCRTDKEDVRDAAKQALLVLGKQWTTGNGPIKERSVMKVKEWICCKCVPNVFMENLQRSENL